MASRSTRQLIQDQQTQSLPCRDSRYRMGPSVAAVLKRTKLTAAVVGQAAAKYLLLIATNAYLVELRARGALAGGAGNRSLAALSCGAQGHMDRVYRTDAPYVAESRAVVDARRELERVSGGRVLEACLVYLYAEDCCDEATRQRILGAFQLLARCAFALLNRLERQLQVPLSRLDVERLLVIMKREIIVSRRAIMPEAFPKGGPKKPLLVICMATAVDALTGQVQASRPLLLAWIALVTQEEICRADPRRFLDSDFHKALLACLAFHFGFALPTDRRELDIKRAQYGVSKKLYAAIECYWGFDDDDDGCFEVYYSMPKTSIANVPEPIATQLLSDAHTKGPHRLLDLDSPATVKLIADAYNHGSPCDAVEVAHFLQDRASYQTVKVNV
ncbi:unnamed protein product [Pelagomonas calceolata]|uniref:Uncharacterized protein n=1 Tax=Pelagomonas calceolata TaxID=35677 RepID=A0A8J2WKV4_9STRA|nr:unnamed protein product [Pelagomonas calceolata]